MECATKPATSDVKGDGNEFKQVSTLVVLTPFSQGCATQPSSRQGSAPEDAETASAVDAEVPALVHCAPGDVAFIAPEEFQAGTSCCLDVQLQVGCYP